MRKGEPGRLPRRQPRPLLSGLSELVLNRWTRLELLRDDEHGGAIVGVEVRARIKGKARSVQRVMQADSPALFDLLFKLAVTRRRPEIDIEIPSPCRAELERLGMFVHEDEVAAEVTYEGPQPGELSWPREAVRQAARAFEERGVATIDPVLPAARRCALAEYHAKLLAEGYPRFRDEQSARYWMYNEPVSRQVHEQLTPLVRRIVGDEARPSYTYSAWYVPGSELPRHQDRTESVFAVSYLLDYRPAPDGVSPWPIRFHPPGREAPIEIRMPIGSAIVYRGCEIPHERPPLPGGHRATSMFFFYVSSDFTGPLR